ncbi:hypothetical protein D3C86_1345700 [compost metagenome]
MGAVVHRPHHAHRHVAGEAALVVGEALDRHHLAARGHAGDAQQVLGGRDDARHVGAVAVVVQRTLVGQVHQLGGAVVLVLLDLGDEVLARHDAIAQVGVGDVHPGVDHRDHHPGVAEGRIPRPEQRRAKAPVEAAEAAEARLGVLGAVARAHPDVGLDRGDGGLGGDGGHGALALGGGGQGEHAHAQLGHVLDHPHAEARLQALLAGGLLARLEGDEHPPGRVGAGRHLAGAGELVGGGAHARSPAQSAARRRGRQGREDER